METMLIIGLVAVVLLLRPASQTQVIYVPMPIEEKRSGPGCLPLIVVGVLALLVIIALGGRDKLGMGIWLRSAFEGQEAVGPYGLRLAQLAPPRRPSAAAPTRPRSSRTLRSRMPASLRAITVILANRQCEK